ncbi:hypothetical protein [Hyalangium versicolor]|uniref:hypothetical protein n=1 Tax=Hyalangium versicolor TaxID=2861190 RepID=UPI001CCD9B0A|nr:hypothetical protein [Hyalangium versicolor]
MEFLLAGLFIVVAIAVLILVRWRRARPAPCLPQQYEAVPRTGTFALKVLHALPPFVRERPVLEGQTPEWRAEMEAVGHHLRRSRVRKVVFVHGTFVGDDPTLMLTSLAGPLSALSPELLPTLRRVSKFSSDRMMGDLGNYTAEYVSLFEQALGGGFESTRFLWSSANHHVARLLAAANLLRLLSAAELGRARALLVGHSHGGQVLALLTQLIYPTATAPKLWDALRELGEPADELKKLALTLARSRLDIATFGMPPRYGFATGPRCRALHVVNHRGQEPRAASLGGVLYTEGGDYVQQWGIAGSDLPASNAKERELAARLDALLGAGCDVKAWLQHVRHRARVSQYGFSYLVDYGDRGVGGMPNFLGTCFGHGVYTRYDAMLFNAELLATHFYGYGRGSRAA